MLEKGDFLCQPERVREVCMRCAHRVLALTAAHTLLFLPANFLIHSIFPLNGKDRLLCASPSRSLLNSYPQSSRTLSEKNPIFFCWDGGRGRGEENLPNSASVSLPKPTGKGYIGPFQGSQQKASSRDCDDAFICFREDVLFLAD